MMEHVRLFLIFTGKAGCGVHSLMAFFGSLAITSKTKVIGF
jgi:hypothetical protein